MSIAKQPNDADADLVDSNRPIVTYVDVRDTGTHTGDHQHLRGQVLYASTGTMSVVTEDGTWAVPPEQAVWIPPRIRHDVRSDGALAMRSLYLDVSVAKRFARRCEVWNITPLLRELIIAFGDLEVAQQLRPSGRRVAAVILDQLQALEAVPFHLPLPSDPRARAISERLLRDPADPRELAALADSVGASSRTIARLFLQQTGMSFGQWRRQLRVLAAVSKLGAGESVTEVAYDLGYQSPSAFVAMFKRVLGESPGRYFSQLRTK